ncbi:HAMP domain-containing protein [Sediminibacillus dalangtanensis]|uniref:HAMP domain-containing protein n=1 Tax=Sediminibacillus dalangtanensis TaxID=2729421 RepID=A0ABX7VSQ7_9BACI|nr:HAMP domain-containing methyl-accepting chemotaxis protein [Sediminibacillus dalangtanensis]QTM98503.1 HAMP domain-containing protein [Sediminibacillus dalangtanensis]
MGIKFWTGNKNKEHATRRSAISRFLLKNGKWKNITISRKLLLQAFLTIGLYLTAAVIMGSLLISLVKDIHHIKLQEERAVQMTEIGSLIRSKDIRIADYITFLRSEDQQEYRQLRNSLNEKIEEVSSAVADTPAAGTFQQIEKNNQKIDKLFVDNVVPSVVRGDTSIYTDARLEISSLRNQNVELLDQLKAEVQADSNKLISIAENRIRTGMISMAAVVLIVSIVSAGMAILIARSLRQGLKQIVEVSHRIADGDLTNQEIDYQGEDEIGQLTQAVNKMNQRIKEMVGHIKQTSRKVSGQSNFLHRHSNEVQQASENIASTMQQLSASSQEQAGFSQSIHGIVSSFYQDIDRVDAKGAELADSSRQVLSATQAGSESMKSTTSQMKEVHAIFEGAVKKMRNLDQSSKEISHLVEVIKGIAAQTNLLALNASIEAARAGTAGKGFAVVAEEVRKLATQVELSISEITRMISGIQTDTAKVSASLTDGYEQITEGKQQSLETETSFNHIRGEMEGMAEGIQTISQTIRQLSLNSKDINQSVDKIAAITNQFSGGFEQASVSILEQKQEISGVSDSAATLAEYARELDKAVARFTI